MTYDLTVRGVGTFAVFVGTVRRRVVRQSRAPAAQRGARSTSPPSRSCSPSCSRAIATRSGGSGAGRRSRVGASGAASSHRCATHDSRSPKRSTAGARLEPGLVYQALPVRDRPGVDPRAHVHGRAARSSSWPRRRGTSRARDGAAAAGRRAQHRRPRRRDGDDEQGRVRADAPRRAAAPGDRPQIRGDRDAVAALKRWTDLARR